MAELGKYHGRPVRAVYVGTGGTPIEYVPVVRCKDCKYFSPCEEVDGVSWTGFCKYGEFHTDEDDFCSRGERKDHEHH